MTTKLEKGPAIDRSIFNDLEYLVQGTARNLEQADAAARELMEEAKTPEEIRYSFNAFQEDVKNVMDGYSQNLGTVLGHGYEAGKIDDRSRRYLGRASMQRLKDPGGKTIEELFKESPDRSPENPQGRQESVAYDVASKARETLGSRPGGRQKTASRAMEFADYAFRAMAEEGGVTRIEARSNDNKIKLKNHNFTVTVPLSDGLDGKPKGANYQILHSLIAYARRQENLMGEDGRELENGLPWKKIEIHLSEDYSSKHHAGDLKRDSDAFLRKNRVPAVRCAYA